VLLNPRKWLLQSGVTLQRCNWRRWNGFSCVIDAAETISALSLTPRNWFSTVSLTLLIFEYYRTSRRIWSHMRNGSNLLVRDPGGVDFDENPRVEISWHFPFKSYKHQLWKEAAKWSGFVFDGIWPANFMQITKICNIHGSIIQLIFFMATLFCTTQVLQLFKPEAVSLDL
jgi:hypothetical protein